MKGHIYLKLGVICLLFTSLLASCSKTEYEPTKLPYKEITKFAIAGFVAGDTVTGVITTDEILVYWDQAVPLPETITPKISVSTGARISPAAGTTVTLHEQTKFTVTADDGSTQDYRIKFILQQPDPIILSTNTTVLQWTDSPFLGITGQYFLAGGDPTNIRVFARRLRDGVEFDLNVDPGYTKSVALRASLPAFTTASDTGRHDIFLSVAQKTIEVSKVRINAPSLRSDFFSFTRQPSSLSAGDDVSILIDDKAAGAILKLYRGRFAEVWLNLEQSSPNSYKQLKISNVTEDGNTIKFKIPADASTALGYKLTSIFFRIKDTSHWEGYQTYSHITGDKNITIQ
ncbi:hypothetical protein [Sphingobacterium faecale]|uniref:DUF5018 domain-containing protein n=1 Tax=Sphingobacterium faecale TaxID=2803775 RepID=A0ABS1QYK2_9SPHI|nr:hypothetical protein [Sphingobacterium faecale]MBL1407250.1 hypothetical protein [Sphingobacterium faecale]